MVKDPFNIVTVQYNSTELLETFLLSAGSSLKSFRYFEKRPFSVLTNHVVTCIAVLNGKPVGYGHLDKDGEKVWLGIAVASDLKGQGLGTKIMEFLISKATENKIITLYLTVDMDNIYAINLYKKFGFVFIKDINERSILMECKI